MIIVVPVDIDKKSICVSFGRTPYFLVKNTDTEEVQVFENPAASQEGAAGISAAQFIIDLKADVLITKRCGQNAADVLIEAGVLVYQSEDTAALSNIAACQEGKLKRMEHFHAGFHGIR